MTARFAAATEVCGSSSHRTFHDAAFMDMPPCTRRSASLACSKVSPSHSCPNVRPVGRDPPRVAAQRAPGERHPPVPSRARRALRRECRAVFHAADPPTYRSSCLARTWQHIQHLLTSYIGYRMT